MISFRTHVVSLVAVLLALAAGVALGGGPLSDVGRGALSSASTSDDTRQRPAGDGFGEEFARESAGRLYAGRLDTHPTVLLTLPGADDAVVADLVAQVEAAGGEVTGTLEVRQGLVAAGEKALVDTLGSQLMQSTDPEVVDRAAPTYVRMGQLMARVLSSQEAEGESADARSSSLRESLVAAELLAGGPEGDLERAPLVLVVGGDDVDDDVLSGLLTGLASRSVGVVATGATRSADVEGLRTSPAAADVATVDGSETQVGRVAAVLALIRSLKDPGGAFGASGSDGALPLG